MSPNHDARPPGAAIDAVVLHYTGMRSGAAARARLCDPGAKVSAHWLLHEDGRAEALVAEERRAWHAGVSAWQGRPGLNDGSIGIEIVNQGHAHGLVPFPQRQIDALVELLGDILSRWRVPLDRVLAHSDIAPDRKIDPGELFPWAALGGLGLPGLDRGVRTAVVDAALARRLLERLGYPLGSGPRGFALALGAFQRRHCPYRVDGRLRSALMGDLLALAMQRGLDDR